MQNTIRGFAIVVAAAAVTFAAACQPANTDTRVVCAVGTPTADGDCQYGIGRNL